MSSTTECSCYSMSHSDMAVHPVLCSIHERQRDEAIKNRTFKYQRYFDTEQDAEDRRQVIYSMHPSEGYGTEVYVVPVGRWWMVLASWYSAD